MFAHAARKQRLADCVVDLMRAGVQKVFALQKNLRATRMCSEPPGVEQRGGPSGVVAQQQIEFAPKIWVASSPHELSRQLVERRHQCFRNKASAKFSPVTVFVRFAFSDHKWRCHVERSAATKCEV